MQYSHVINGLPLDTVYDILEGFATDFLQKPWSYLMHLKALTPEMVNVSIRLFNYSPIDQVNKPHALKIFSVTTLNVKQTAREMWNLIRYPLLFGEHIQTRN